MLVHLSLQRLNKIKICENDIALHFLCGNELRITYETIEKTIVFPVIVTI